MNILALSAHPDDLEIGCGGTLLKYARAGHRVYLMVLTDGSQGGDAPARRTEQLASGKILGAQEVFWGGYHDTELPVSRDAIQQIEDVVKKVDPAFIFVNYTDDTHQDHRHLATCTLTATRYTRNVLFYETPTTQNFSPTVYVDIDGLLEEKVRALQAHASQVEKTNIESLSILEVARASAHFRGLQGRVRSAEAFVPLRLFINVESDLA
ncbi:MAG TPA: PIG-L deacetylase family protein [Nitrospirales bacterium]|jgi:LmbE family N-acetylglucosaminyl deacetylase|nr:PIG-L deacetylase family protein [Nitrospirales bacterium]